MTTKLVRELLREIGQNQLFFASKDVSVFAAARMMTNKNVGALVVLDRTDNSIVGIVSERDVVTKVVALGKNPAETIVERIMTAKVKAVTPFTNLDECEALMKELGVRHLPVISDGKVVGMVSIRDLLVSTRADAEWLTNELKGYVQGNR